MTRRLNNCFYWGLPLPRKEARSRCRFVCPIQARPKPLLSTATQFPYKGVWACLLLAVPGGHANRSGSDADENPKLTGVAEAEWKQTGVMHRRPGSWRRQRRLAALPGGHCNFSRRNVNCHSSNVCNVSLQNSDASILTSSEGTRGGWVTLVEPLSVVLLKELPRILAFSACVDK